MLIPAKPGPPIGRAEELQRLRALISAARNGSSGALALRGDPGIGKSTVLEHATTDLAGFRVIRVDGYEAESHMAYAAVQRLGAPLAVHVTQLPERQRAALLVAAGMREGPPPERFLVGLGVLSLLSAAAAESPLVCVVDDAHHLDPESLDVLAFVARRLSAESTVLLFAARSDPHLDAAFAGVPELRLEGLDTLSAVALLRASLRDELDPFVAARIAEQTGGNPLALHDLAEELSARQLTMTALTPDPAPVGSRLEAHYLAKLSPLPDESRLWLLVAAAETTGDPETIAAAAGELGLPETASAAAEAVGLVDIHDTVAFRHPLARSAVYNGMPAHDRRRVHGALRDQSDLRDRPVVAAWHDAASVVGVDAAVAARIEAVAADAGARGGLSTQARLLARAAELTPPGPERDQRLLSAAEAAIGAAAGQLGLALLDRVDPEHLDAAGRGRALWARAVLSLLVADREEIVSSPAHMLRAAREFRSISPDLEQRAILQAIEFSLATEWTMTDVTLDDIGRRARQAAGAAPGALATTLRAVGALIREPYESAVPLLREAAQTIEALDDAEVVRFGFVCVVPTIGQWDASACVRILRRVARTARDAGALRMLEAVLWVLGVVELTRGDPAAAGRHIGQVRELRRAIGHPGEHVVNAAHLAWSGAPRAEILAAIDALVASGFGGALTIALTGLGIRDIADGRYGEAYDRFAELADRPFLQATLAQMPELVEAGVRSGHTDEILPVVARLRVQAEASATPWVRGIAARSTALVSPDDDAEPHYVEAVALLAQADMPGQAARAHLLYGEWLRRMRRRRDAREQLRRALAIFTEVGALPFAQRARRELEATGERVIADARGGAPELTPQETSIARLAASGATNAEIGATLFISPNTVDYHLRKVFRKLAVTSRKQLAEVLPATAR